MDSSPNSPSGPPGGLSGDRIPERWSDAFVSKDGLGSHRMGHVLGDAHGTRVSLAEFVRQSSLRFLLAGSVDRERGGVDPPRPDDQVLWQTAGRSQEFQKSVFAGLSSLISERLGQGLGNPWGAPRQGPFVGLLPETPRNFIDEVGLVQNAVMQLFLRSAPSRRSWSSALHSLQP
jgi:hypothetical protein